MRSKLYLKSAANLAAHRRLEPDAPHADGRCTPCRRWRCRRSLTKSHLGCETRDDLAPAPPSCACTAEAPGRCCVDFWPVDQCFTATAGLRLEGSLRYASVSVCPAWSSSAEDGGRRLCPGLAAAGGEAECQYEEQHQQDGRGCPSFDRMTPHALLARPGTGVCAGHLVRLDRATRPPQDSNASTELQMMMARPAGRRRGAAPRGSTQRPLLYDLGPGRARAAHRGRCS